MNRIGIVATGRNDGENPARFLRSTGRRIVEDVAHRWPAVERPQRAPFARVVLALSILAVGLVLTPANAEITVTPKDRPHFAPAQLTSSMDDGSRLTIAFGDDKILEFAYVAWAANWKWSNTAISSEPTGSGDTWDLSGEIRDLGVKIAGSVHAAVPTQYKFDWSMDVARDVPEFTAMGLEFRIPFPLTSFPQAETELTEDKHGFNLRLNAHDMVSVRFEHPIEELYFERGQKGAIRAYFAKDSLAAGSRHHAMTVTVPDQEFPLDLATTYDRADVATWTANVLDPLESPVDLRFLNEVPAGRHGFVRAQGDAFVFEDGTPVRFWGTNVAAYSLFSSKLQIAEHARRLAKLGYNLVRLHHHDSMAWVGPTVIDLSRPDSQRMDAEGLNRIDYWIKCLKEAGIYVWLDLNTGRLFKPGDELGPGASEIFRRGGGPEKGGPAQGFAYFNPRVEALMRDFNRKYLTRKNPYTGLSYVDDPAVMGVLITNENDITHHFGNLMLPDKNNPHHNAVFTAAAHAFAERSSLPFDKVWRSWEAGPSKLFLSDVERRWNDRMIGHLGELGVKVPVATTQMWAGMPLSGLLPLSAGTMIDVHAYGAPGALNTDPRREANFVQWAATGALAGRPMAISEWNVRYPAPDRFVAPLYIAAIAGLQDWDAPMLYNYAQVPLDPSRRLNQWSTYLDPAITGVMPAAALLYRRGDVASANQTFALRLTAQNAVYRNASPKTSKSLRTLVEKSKLRLVWGDLDALDWHRATDPPAGAILVDDLETDFAGDQATSVRSDTDEILRSWEHGHQVISTPRTQAVQGWIGHYVFDLDDVSFDIETNKAMVAVQSLDGLPIAQSQRILITAVARAQVEGSGGTKRILSEPVEGSLTLRVDAGRSFYALRGDGRAEMLPGRLIGTEGWTTLSLRAADRTHWYLIR